MDKQVFAILIWATAYTALGLLVLPTVVFLFTGWRIRRDKLISYLGVEALELYYKQFPWTPSTEIDLTKRFKTQFNYLYGRRHFIMPLLVFFSVSLICVWVSARSIQAHFAVAPFALRLPDIALFAMTGGFVWVISDQLGRLARRDIAPKDIYGWTFRVLLSIPFGISMGALGDHVIKNALALFLGAFPTQTLFTIARRIATKRLDLGDQESDGKVELAMLQSVSRDKAETFQDQGIDTAAALAWADPVDLTIRTNFDFNYVLDCMSQALLWVYFQDKTKCLFPLSLRGSQEVLSLVNILNGQSSPTDPDNCVPFDKSKAQEAVKEMASILGISEAALRVTLDQVAADPYTQFIAKVWH